MEDRFVIFLDILGSKDVIKNGSENIITDILKVIENYLISSFTFV